MDKHMMVMIEQRGFAKAPPAPQMFGNAGVEWCEKHGANPAVMAKIAEKNHRHSVNNPYSQFRDVYTLDQILKSPPVFGPLTKLQCCPTSEGGAAAIVCSEAFVKKHKLESQAVEICMAMATGTPCGLDLLLLSSLFSCRSSEHVRREELHQDGRIRYVEEGGGAGLCDGEDQTVRHSSDRIARLFLRERADHIRSARCVSNIRDC
jgi:acetyl-CoA acetyltransferase